MQVPSSTTFRTAASKKECSFCVATPSCVPVPPCPGFEGGAGAGAGAGAGGQTAALDLSVFGSLPYLHDPFLCGVLPLVLKWHTETAEASLRASVFGPGSVAYDASSPPSPPCSPRDVHDLLEYLEKDCSRFNGELYEDYCYFWTLEYAVNIRAVLNHETPPFVHVFETYRRFYECTPPRAAPPA